MEITEITEEEKKVILSPTYIYKLTMEDLNEFT